MCDRVNLLPEECEVSSSSNLAETENRWIQPQISHCDECDGHFILNKRGRQSKKDKLLCPNCRSGNSSLTSLSICDMYIHGMSACEIGKMINCDPGFVYRILDDNQIKHRSKSEAGAKHVRWNVCVICGEKFRPRPEGKGYARFSRKTCDNPECLFKLMSQCRFGDKNYNWKGGYSQSHYRMVVGDKNERFCEFCGTSNGMLIIHHMDKDKTNNNPENLWILCNQCHSWWHYHRGEQN